MIFCIYPRTWVVMKDFLTICFCGLLIFLASISPAIFSSNVNYQALIFLAYCALTLFWIRMDYWPFD